MTLPWGGFTSLVQNRAWQRRLCDQNFWSAAALPPLLTTPASSPKRSSAKRRCRTKPNRKTVVTLSAAKGLIHNSAAEIATTLLLFFRFGLRRHLSSMCRVLGHSHL